LTIQKIFMKLQSHARKVNKMLRATCEKKAHFHGYGTAVGTHTAQASGGPPYARPMDI
jgi:hypothetical protein